MNKLVEPVSIERVLDEIEDDVTLTGMAHAPPPPRARSRATILIALIAPAVCFGGLVIVLLLRGDPVVAIRGSSSASVQSAPSNASATPGAQDPAQRSEPIAQNAEPAAAKGAAVATNEDFAVEESQSALLRFMARGTVRDLPTPRRPGTAAPADVAPAPANADANGRAAVVGAAAVAGGNAANSATVPNATSGVGNANIVPGNAVAAVRGTTAPDPRAAGGADGATTVPAAVQGLQQGAALGATPSTTQAAAPNAAGSAAPIAAAVIPTPPPSVKPRAKRLPKRISGTRYRSTRWCSKAP